MLEVVRAEAEVLVVAAERLVVEIDVEQLARVPRLGDGVQEVEPGHVLVRHLRVDADHVGMVERGMKPSIAPVVGR